MLAGGTAGTGLAVAEGAAEGEAGGRVPTDDGMVLTVCRGALHATATSDRPSAARTAASPGSVQRHRGLPYSALPLR